MALTIQVLEYLVYPPCGYLCFRDLDFCAVHSHMLITTFKVKVTPCLAQAALLEGPAWISIQLRGTFRAARSKHVNQIIAFHFSCECNSFWLSILLKCPGHPLPNFINARTAEPSRALGDHLVHILHFRNKQLVQVHTAILRQDRDGNPYFS